MALAPGALRSLGWADSQALGVAVASINQLLHGSIMLI